MPYLLAAADPRRPSVPAASPPDPASARKPAAPSPSPSPPPSTVGATSALRAAPATSAAAAAASSAPASRRGRARRGARARPQGWSPGDVRHLVRARASGAGLWVCEGRVVALATGRTLATLSGVEEVVEARPFGRHAGGGRRGAGEGGGDEDAEKNVLPLTLPGMKYRDAAAAASPSQQNGRHGDGDAVEEDDFLRGTVATGTTPTNDIVFAPAATHHAQPSATSSAKYSAAAAAAAAAPPLSHSATLVVRDSLFYTAPASGALLRAFRLRPGVPARPVRHVLPPAAGVVVGRARADGALVLARATPSPRPSNEGKRDGQKAIERGSSDAGGDDGSATATTEAGKNDASATQTTEAAAKTTALGRAGGERAFTVVREAPTRVGSGMHSLLVASWAFVGRRVSLSASSPSSSKTGGGGGGAAATPAVVERCDYTVGRGDGVWNWSRVGRCPAWYGRGQCVTYVRARKVRGWHDVDARVRAWMQAAGRGRLADKGPVVESYADAGVDKQDGSAIGAGADGAAAGTVVADGSRPSRRKLFGVL